MTRQLPAGEVTLMFTDIEGSTRLLRDLGDGYADALAEHRRIVRDVVGAHDGFEVDTQGDAFLIAFARASEAVRAAEDVQRALAGGPIGVRMGLHTGEPQPTEEGYVGVDVHRASRIAAAGHAGQVLLSQATRSLVEAPARDLGSHRLKDLSAPEHIFQLQIEGLPSDFPPLRTLEVSSELPIARTSFIGRERDVAELGAVLTEQRCVTVTGTGGAGKTRLATEVARVVRGRYDHGATFVGLAPVLDPTLVPAHVATALGDVGSHADDVTAALAAFLRDRRLLLVLDNCEHVVQAVAELVEALMTGCPDLAVLATSREPIGTAGEVVFTIRPLEIPELESGSEEQDGSESVRLYTDRVRSFDRTFEVDDSNRAAVVSICRTLDGIPLAIELAAARTRAMAPADIADRMDDRFALLSSDSRTGPARHQTLRTTIEWSYDLCPEDARTILRRLSVFTGGWRLEAAEAVVAGGPIERERVAGLLAVLVDRSLVERTVTAGDSRYRLLETIRQFAHGALVETGEAEAVSRRHCEWFAGLAEEAEPQLKGADQMAWLRRLDLEHDNFRAAIGWSLGTDDATGAFKLVGALGWFWFMRGHWHEAWRWVERCLDYDGEVASTLRAKVIYATGSIEIIRGKLEPVTRQLRTALDACRRAGDRLGEAWTLHYLGHSAGWTDGMDAIDLMRQGLEIFEALDEPWAVGWSWRYIGQQLAGDENLELQKRALDRFRELGDRWCAAYSLYLIGATYLADERYAEAVEAEQEALDIATELGDVIWRAHALGRLGLAAHYQGDPRRAERLLGEGMELHRRIGDENCTAVLSGYLGLVRISEARWDEAVATLAESLRLWRKLDNGPAIAAYLGRFAAALAGRGEARDAAVIYGATLSPDTPQALIEAPWFVAERGALEERLRLELGSDYESLVADGMSLGLDEACEKGLALA
jgi:predicted ATPase/class 3 adenylate cyclase